MQSQPVLVKVPSETCRVTLVFVLLVVQSVATAGGAVEPLATTRVATGLNLPAYVTHAPDDFARLFIVELGGRIKILNLSTGQINPDVFLNIASLVQGREGMLGLAFHPEYASNGYFYVHYTNPDTVVQRFRVSADPDIADPESGVTVFTLFQPFENHNGGWIDFGPDGYLYIALGDGGDQQDPDNRAQNLNDLHGKILRIDVNGDDFPGNPNRNYAIPPDNPFIGVAGEDEIWAYGLRNPWRCSFDQLNGDLYIADVGQWAWEEINFQPAGSPGGENYGWRCYEGDHPFNTDGCPLAETMVSPIHEYFHNAEGGWALIGGYVYRGCDIPTLDGAYFFADIQSGHIWSLMYDGNFVTNLTLHDAELLTSIEGFPISQIVSFGEDAAGEIYIVQFGAAGIVGEVFRIIPQTPTIPFGDIDCDGIVGVPDLLILLASWGLCPDPPADCPADLDGDGAVAVPDLLILLANWG